MARVEENALKLKNWDTVEGMALRKSGVALQSDMGLVDENDPE